MANTPKLGLPYPDLDQSNWFANFEAFAEAVDAFGGAHREDRNLVVMGGGTFTFNAVSGSLAWAETIEVLSPLTGLLVSISPGAKTIADGQIAYIDMTRSPTSNTQVSLQVSSQVPNTNAALLVCIRRDTIIYFRNGNVLTSGIPGYIFESSGGTGDLKTTLSLGNTSGARNIEMSAGQGVVFNEGVAVSTGADQGAIYVKSDNKLYYRAESNGVETDLTAGGDLNATLTAGNTSGSNNIEMNANYGVIFNEGTAVSTGANQGALYVKADNKLYYRAESDGVETDLTAGGGGGDLATTLGLGNTTGTNDIVLTSGDALTAAAGDPVTIDTPTGSGGASGNITITTGTGDATFDGGDILLTSGDGGAGGGAGGRITVQGGSGNGGLGGAVDILGGVGGTSGGGVFIKSGAAAQLRIETSSTAATVGDLNILGGNTSSGVGGTGGKINITAGSNSGGAGSGGAVDIDAGNASGGGVGGAVTINAGTGSLSLAGGAVSIVAGTGGPSNGPGGDSTLQGGTGGATNGPGGDVRLIPGAGSGSGADGQVQSEGVHEFQAQQVYLEIAEPSTAASTGATFASDGSGGLSNNGLYYRRESNGASIRLDLVQPYEYPASPKDEVDGLTAEKISNGPFAFNAADYPNHGTFAFWAVLSVNDTARTGEAYLYNLTDAEEVTNSRVSVTGAGSTNPAKVTGSLTVGAAAGNLKNAEKLYEVRITNDGTGDNTKLTYLGVATIRVEA